MSATQDPGGHLALRRGRAQAAHPADRTRSGAFIAWHGFWNRAPLPQQGYKGTYSPFDGTQPAGDHEVFADGFAGADTLAGSGEAESRPTGLAVGPEGSLYVSDDARGCIWRITYVGTDD